MIEITACLVMSGVCLADYVKNDDGGALFASGMTFGAGLVVALMYLQMV